MANESWKNQLDYQGSQRQMIAEARQTAAVSQERLRESYSHGCRDERAFQENLRAGALEREGFKRHLDWLFFGIFGVILGFFLGTLAMWKFAQ